MVSTPKPHPRTSKTANYPSHGKNRIGDTTSWVAAPAAPATREEHNLAAQLPGAKKIFRNGYTGPDVEWRGRHIEAKYRTDGFTTLYRWLRDVQILDFLDSVRGRARAWGHLLYPARPWFWWARRGCVIAPQSVLALWFSS